MMAAAWHDLSDLQRDSKVHVSAVARGVIGLVRTEMGHRLSSTRSSSPLPKCA